VQKLYEDTLDEWPGPQESAFLEEMS
jgi:hypothetical protein